MYGYAGGSSLQSTDPRGLLYLFIPPKPEIKKPAQQCSDVCKELPLASRILGGEIMFGCEGAGGGGGGGGSKRASGPSQRQIDKFKKQLETDGPKSLEKSEKSLERNLAEHQEKLKQIQSEGGLTSSVEREIRTFTEELAVIRSLLGK